MQQPRGLVRAEDDLGSVAAIADLGFARRTRELRRRPLANDLSLAQDGHSIRELFGLVEVVRRQEDRLAERAEGTNHLPRRASRRRIETGRRLVEEHEIRIPDERDAEIEPSLLPAGEALHACVALLRESDELDHLVDVAPSLVVAGEHAVNLADGQVREELGLLQHDADALSKRTLGTRRVVTENRDIAGVSRAITLEDLHRCRLARAVRAEQSEHLALRDVEADAPDGFVLAVRLVQVADGDRRAHARKSSTA